MEDDALLEVSPKFDSHRGKQRKGKQSVLIIVLVVCILLFVTTTIALAAILGYRENNRSSESSSGDTCTTPTCIDAASFLRKSLDTSVNPCEDFYKYSCGNWEDTNVIPEGFGVWSTFSQLSESNSIALKNALEQPVPEGDTGAVSKARHMYANCMDLDLINNAKAEPLQALIQETGGWELVKISEPEPWSLLNLAVEHYWRSDAFFKISIGADDFNSSMVVIQFTQSGLTLPGSTYYTTSDSTYENATKAYMKSVLTLLGAEDDPDSELDDVINQIYAVEKDLAEIFMPSTDLRNASLTYNAWTIGDFNGNFTSLADIGPYLEEYFSLAGSETTFSDNDTIILTTEQYVFDLNDTIEMSKWSTEQMKNYAKWSMVKHYVSLMGQDFLDAYYTFTSAVTGNGERERYLTCVSLVENSLPMAVARPFVDKFFTNSSRQEIADIIDGIRETFKQRLDGKDWLDQETRQRCKEKVDKITQEIAYPEFIKDDEKLNKFYDNVMINANTEFFTSYREVLKYARAEEVSQYGEPTDKTRWYLPPTVVNAYYSPSFNKFVFLAGILRHPFFETGWPSYLSYGAIGVVIGHELTHGFDDQGQQFDGDGNRRKWWTDESQEAFLERTKCFKEQYSQYSLNNQSVNGSLTLGENIADNGGVHTAFQAYKKRGGAPSLPAINLTNDQLFFVSFAQVWCTLYTDAYLQLQVSTNVHSPGPVRVLGALSNSEEFSDAFSCAANTTMNPDDKCQLW